MKTIIDFIKVLIGLMIFIILSPLMLVKIIIDRIFIDALHLETFLLQSMVKK